jgi:uncharacterized RDD family membrane protein YckC
MELLDEGLNAKPTNNLRYATFWRRVTAALIDTVVVGGIIFPLNYYNITAWKSISVLLFVACFGFAYKLFMEYTYSATLGKMITKIIVTDYNYEKPTFNQVFLRNLINIISTLATTIGSFYLFTLPEFKDIVGFMEYQALMAKKTPLTTVNNLIALVYMIDVFMLFGDAQLRAYHDKIAQTYVIHK